MVKPKSSRGLGLENLLVKRWALLAKWLAVLVRRGRLCGGKLLFLNMVRTSGWDIISCFEDEDDGRGEAVSKGVGCKVGVKLESALV